MFAENGNLASLKRQVKKSDSFSETDNDPADQEII